MALDSRHEYPLATRPTTEFWSENYALVFSDPENGIAALYSIGTWYGDTSVWREMLYIPMPDGQILIGRNYGRNTKGDTVSASLSKYQIIEPEKKLRLSFDGPVWSQSNQDLIERGMKGGLAKLLQLDLTFDATAPLWDMHKDAEDDRTGIMGAMHTEQQGVCGGTIRYDGKEFNVTGAPACRDHSRGKREFTPYRNHSWIQCMFPGGRGFHLYAALMEGIDGMALSAASIIEGGIHHPATIKHVEFIGAVTDFGKTHKVVLDSALGEMTIHIRRVLKTMPVSVVLPFEAQPGTQGGSRGLIYDESVEMEWNGQIGVGWVERGFATL